MIEVALTMAFVPYQSLTVFFLLFLPHECSLTTHWSDDLIYVNGSSITNFSSDSIYADGWYAFCAKRSSAETTV